MRLRHFCIGSIRSQDLLISKTFLPLESALDNDAVIQQVWAAFLDLFHAEHHFAPLRSQPSSNHDRHGRPQQSPPASPSISAARPLHPSQDRQSFGRPLYSRDCCFVYCASNDLVLVACCPLPPTPATTSAAVTRIPLSLPGHPISKPAGASLPGHSDIHPATPLSLQHQRPELVFSTAAGLHVSLHGTIEFLGQLVRALERYLLSSSSSSGAGSRKTTSASPIGIHPKSSTSVSVTSSSTLLSAEVVQQNVGIVYEILDECMELGYPMMPSLAHLDLLVFGVAKAS
ncbi:hypothetical protein EDD21DRAFT_22589 [Dissophora ornata]|nr:hypothetical protein BGZ58_009655 [Dissophora ornata]KAI8603636.1 hypothetical protein EDD21DRAFT_22589 [Dissophora ornata]